MAAFAIERLVLLTHRVEARSLAEAIERILDGKASVVQTAIGCRWLKNGVPMEISGALIERMRNAGLVDDDDHEPLIPTNSESSIVRVTIPVDGEVELRFSDSDENPDGND